MKKPLIVTISSILVVMLAMVGLSACGSGEKKNAAPKAKPCLSRTVKVKEDGTFKILQLTDMHLINSTKKNVTAKEPESNLRDVSKNYSLRDEWAMEAVTTVVEEADPDLIIVTGDSIYTNELVCKAYTKTDDNEAAFWKFAKFVDSFKIPWLFIFGNHDEEGSLTEREGSYQGAKKVLASILKSEELKYCWYDDGPEELNGLGNYIINVENLDGTINQSLVMLDSGSYLHYVDETGKLKGDQRKYEYVHDDQLDWYEETIKWISDEMNDGNLVSSILFQHIPFPEYKTVIDAYIKALTDLGEDWEQTIRSDGSGTERTLMTDIGEITYHFGVYNDLDDENQHIVSHSYVGYYPVNGGPYYDGGHVFERAVKLGSTKYIFCGHDHRNTYSFTYQGVRLTYGMSIDYSSNGLSDFWDDNQRIFDETAQRGGTLITLKPNSEVEVKQIPYTRNLYQEAREAEIQKNAK